MTTDLDKTPRFAVDDKVLIKGSGSQRTVWEVDAVLPPTATQPQYGYAVKSGGSGHRRTRNVNEDKLEPAGEDA